MDKELKKYLFTLSSIRDTRHTKMNNIRSHSLISLGGLVPEPPTVTKICGSSSPSVALHIFRIWLVAFMDVEPVDTGAICIPNIATSVSYFYFLPPFSFKFLGHDFYLHVYFLFCHFSSPFLINKYHIILKYRCTHASRHSI